MDDSLSVLLPARNAARTVGAALRSVLRQTRPPDEVVVVDDGSVDATASVVKSTARRAGAFERVRIVRTDGVGIARALQLGLEACRGAWVARMDADDVSLPRRFAAQLEMAARTGADLVATRVSLWGWPAVGAGMARHVAWSNRLVTSRQLSAGLFVDSPVVHPSVLFRRRTVLEAGGYRDGPFPEDYDLWLRLHLRGARMVKVPRVLLRWRDHPARLTRTDPRYAPEAFRTLKVEALRRGFASGGRVQIWGAGRDGKAWLRPLGERGIEVVRYFDVSPRRIGGRVAGRVPVVSWREVDRHRGVPLLVAVGALGARDLIRGQLDALGWREGTDYLCVQ